MLALSIAHRQQAVAIAKRPIWVAEIVWENDVHTDGINDLYFASADYSQITNGPPQSKWMPFLDPERISSVSQTVDPISGVSTIGGLSIEVVDMNALFSTAIRDADAQGYGMNRQRVDLYITYPGEDWANAQVVRRMQISSVKYNGGKYIIHCSDLQRSMKKTVFEPKKDKLAVAMQAADASLTLQDSTAFQAVAHPTATIGYIKIEDEIIGWTGNASNVLSGLSRGAFGTAAAAHAQDVDVQEIVWFRENPISIALRILANADGSLPPHWTLAMDSTTSIDSTRWQDEGALVAGYDPNDATAGFQMEFVIDKGSDGKRFIESEIMRIMGAFMPVTGEGKLALRGYSDLSQSESAIGVDALPGPQSPVIDASVAVKWSGLKVLSNSDLTTLVRMDYDEFPKTSGKFIRTALFVDAVSEAKHGHGKEQRLSSKGLIPQGVFLTQIYQRFQRVLARFSRPPMRMDITMLPKMSALEIGDVVRIRLPVRDPYTGGDINRVFEIVKQSVQPKTGEVRVSVIAQPEQAVITGFNPAFFSDVVYQTGVLKTWNGTTDLTLASGDYYWNGDLTIAAGATLTISGTVRLFLTGTLTVNGSIIGKGAGQAAIGGFSMDYTTPPGYVGRGGHGNAAPVNFNEVWESRSGFHTGQHADRSLPAPGVQFQTPPVIQVIGTSENGSGQIDAVSGLPTNLIGAAGGRGSSYRNVVDSSTTPWGGWLPAAPMGGPGGAGLMIMARGIFITQGSVDLSGSAGEVGTSVSRGLGQGLFSEVRGKGGAGGGGSFVALAERDANGLPNLSVFMNNINTSGGDSGAGGGQKLAQVVG